MGAIIVEPGGADVTAQAIIGFVVIAAEGEASDTTMRHPLALQLRNLQTLAELGVEKNTTVVFPAPLMSAIGELTAFLAHEASAAKSTSPETHGQNGSAGSVPVDVISAVHDNSMAP
jgi:hypothetical protein